MPYAEAGELWGKTYFLAGIRHEQPRIERTLLAMRGIEESSTYQFVTRRSALNEARKLVLALGTDLLGESDAAVQSKLHAIGDLSVLEQIHLRILRVKSWDELQLPPAAEAPLHRGGRTVRAVHQGTADPAFLAGHGQSSGGRQDGRSQ